jgi:hypothetical protein
LVHIMLVMVIHITPQVENNYVIPQRIRPLGLFFLLLIKNT